MAVVGVARELAGFGFLGRVAGVVVLVECRIDADTALDKPVVGIIGPCTCGFTVGVAVAILISQFNTAFWSGSGCAMRTPGFFGFR